MTTLRQFPRRPAPSGAGPSALDPVADRPGSPRWARPALIGLLAAAALLYLWDLSASGYANAFYSAAAQAGSRSWEAFFFGSSDAGNSITVDKTPASLWLMALSVRAFGLSSWSILVPQALIGVATVGVLYATVRRYFGAGAGLLAGGVLALTPVAALMFRFNNPDALLVLLLTAAAWALMRALEGAATRWLVWVGVLVGLGFLTKMLQALLVVPVFALVYLVAAPTPVRRRILQLLAGGAALLVSAGWWVAAVQLVPASMRPYIGGSQGNSVLELALGYNGFGRLTGNENGSVGGGNGWGSTGLTRMFGTDIGGQIAWLLPAALILLAVGLVLLRSRPRTDLQRSALLVWGGTLLLTGLVFSFMAGIFHQYYTVALAPSIGALVGIGTALVWRRRSTWLGAGVLTAVVATTAVWSSVLLARSATFLPWLRPLVLFGGLVATAGFLAARLLTVRLLVPAAALAVAASLAGPAAYAIQTVGQGHTGSIVTAGPDVASGGFGGRFGGAPGPFGGQRRLGGQGSGAPGTLPGGAAAGAGRFRGFGGSAVGPTGGFGAGGGMGGLLDGASVNSALAQALSSDASSYTWVAATVGSQNAASYQLATQQSVMAIGGFNGTDPSPTLAQFQAWVAAGRIHYFIPGMTGGGRAAAGSGTADVAAQITSWVEQSFASSTIGGTTVYELTAASTTTGSSTSTT